MVQTPSSEREPKATPSNHMVPLSSEVNKSAKVKKSKRAKAALLAALSKCGSWEEEKTSSDTNSVKHQTQLPKSVQVKYES